MIRFAQETCANLESAVTKEWLETNALGGFASSTIINLNTRRYHGLLVAATRPPVGRLVMLSKLEETLVIDGQRFDLSSNQYTGAIHPRGYEYQIGFRLDPFPVFTYLIEGIEIEKSLFMSHGENTTIIRYEFSGTTDASSRIPHPSSLAFEIRPLIAVRDYHSLLRENASLSARFQTSENSATLKPYANLPALHIAHNADSLEAIGEWYRNFEYGVEHDRGFDYKEDLFNPFTLRFDLNRNHTANIIASLEPHEIEQAHDYRRREIERRCAMSHEVATAISSTAPHAADDEFIKELITAADQFIVRRGNQKTIIAGYHWFSDWGRDSMIALPGLTLVTGRYEIARRILTEFACHVDQGMLPNRFSDEGETPEYNTVDATLWFFEATRALLHYTNDYAYVRTELYDVLAEIIRWHVRGTRYGIRVDTDGLLAAGEAGVQLTWMDAKVGDWVVTPRRGKPVEIQALWYNAMCTMKDLAGKFGDETNRKQYAAMAARARESFEELFWNEERNCLYDCIDNERRDAAIRPNQIFAVSLKHSMLSPDKARRVVETVERELLTPVGLRSLAPGDSQYRGRYAGDSLSRDGAYHQGTVWAWLIGHFITAYIKVSGEEAQSREKAKGWLKNMHSHLHEAGVGQVSEIFDGDVPHTPAGCVAQAWSVAELLRAAIEDVYGFSQVTEEAPNRHAASRT